MLDKRILHIAPTPFFSDRGCHIRIEGMVRCLTELNYDNTVCTYHHGRDVTGVVTKRIKPIANYTQTEAGPSKYKLLADWRLLLLCLKEYRRIKPTTIHAHLHEGLLIGLIVKWVFFWRRTALVGDMQGSLTGELHAHGAFNKRPFLKWPVKCIEWLLMKLADQILCSSQHSLDKIQSEFAVKSNKIHLVQDGADQAKPLATATKADLIQQWQLPVDKTLVIYSGALLDSKGLTELKEIINQADSALVHFLIVGYPVTNLTPYLEQEQLNTHCTLTGQVKFEQLNDYLSLADIAIDPKQNDAGEGSGKMLNYLANGLPVVAFNTINNQSFLPEESTLANNVEDIVAQLNRLANDKVLRKNIAAANLAHFQRHYSWLKSKQQLTRIYQ